MNVTYTKPLLPLRDIVIFPSIVVPLFVGREKSIKALQEAMKTDKSIILVAQKNSETDDPVEKDLFSYGCMSKVLQLLKLPDGTVKVLVEGQKRVKIMNIKNETSYLNCDVEIADDTNISKDLDVYAQGLVKKFEKLIVLNKKDFNENLNVIKNSKDAKIIADNIAANLNIKIFQKQEILEIRDLRKRLEKINQLISQFELESVTTIKAKYLSGGQKKKLVIAMALVNNPKLLLLDECFAALDIMTIKNLQQIIVDLQTHNKISIILCDHQARDLLSCVDLAIVLSNGKVIAKDTPNNLIQNIDAQNAYFGDSFKIN